jgi:hypothetical protein
VDSKRKLSPAGALLVTKHVLISEQKHLLANTLETWTSSAESSRISPLAGLNNSNRAITSDSKFLLSRVHATHGEETLEIIFPSDHQKAVSEAMEQARSRVREGQQPKNNLH